MQCCQGRRFVPETVSETPAATDGSYTDLYIAAFPGFSWEFMEKTSTTLKIDPVGLIGSMYGIFTY